MQLVLLRKPVGDVDQKFNDSCVRLQGFPVRMDLDLEHEVEVVVKFLVCNVECNNVVGYLRVSEAHAEGRVSKDGIDTFLVLSQADQTTLL